MTNDCDSINATFALKEINELRKWNNDLIWVLENNRDMQSGGNLHDIEANKNYVVQIFDALLIIKHVMILNHIVITSEYSWGRRRRTKAGGYMCVRLCAWLNTLIVREQAEFF